jgi:SET domain-containing protein
MREKGVSAVPISTAEPELPSANTAPSAGPPELTRFVREVVLPGGSDTIPRLDPARCRFQLEFRPSLIHRWGLFACSAIPARRRVIEYTGQRIDAREVDRRRFRQHLYIFWLTDHWALDGAFGGSGAEFINHRCDPNLYACVGRGHIFLTSLRRIEPGEELTLDYHTADDYPSPCTCRSPNCRGYF